MRRHLQIVLTCIVAQRVFLERTSKKLGLQVHRVERIDGLVIVGLDLTWERNFHQHQIIDFCLTSREAVCSFAASSKSSPSGISSRPLSAEAMIAVLLMRKSRSRAEPEI